MRMYQVDAFTDRLFAGNPAAVVVLDNWLSDDLMLKISRENNLAETGLCCTNRLMAGASPTPDRLIL